MSMKATRVKREVEKIMKQPPVGISLCTMNDSLFNLRATIMGVAGTPYESGIFKLDVNITERYPFEPPRVRFITPVYHPNIDNNGRICLELLKLPPSGCWRPVVTIEGLLLSIQTLLGTPNPDDPLMDKIAQEYRLNKQEFEKNAREHTLKYACQNRMNHADKTTANNEQKCSNETENGLRNCKRKSSDETTCPAPLKQIKGDFSSENTSHNKENSTGSS